MTDDADDPTKTGATAETPADAGDDEAVDGGSLLDAVSDSDDEHPSDDEHGTVGDEA